MVRDPPHVRAKGGTDVRGVGGRKLNTVKITDTHALAKNLNESLERGGGRVTPKRRNEDFLERLAFQSPAKKRKTNLNNLKDFWTEKENGTLKPSYLPSKIRSDQLELPANHATPEVSHKLSENES